MGKNNKQGYTMLEMIIVLFIIAALSTILFANYHGINIKGDLLRDASRLKNTLRRAQTYSLNKKMDTCYVYGWGVKVDRQKNNYILFADKDNDKAYGYPVKLLIHGREWSSGSSFAESSFFKNTVSVVGNATQVASPGKPGNSSGYWSLNGSGDYLTIPPSSEFDFLDQNFVIDFWLYSNPTNTDERALIYKWGNTTAEQSFYCTKLAISNTVQCGILDNNDTEYSLQSTTAIEQNTWYHIAFTRDGQVLRLYINGQEEARAGLPVDTFVKASGSAINIGIYSDNLSYAWNGFLDEIRIAKGMYYWNSDFSVPTEEYPSDEEKIKQVSLLPGVIFSGLVSNGVAGNVLDLYFSRDDYSFYANNVKDSTAVITLQSANDNGLSENIDIKSSGVIYSP